MDFQNTLHDSLIVTENVVDTNVGSSDNPSIQGVEIESGFAHDSKSESTTMTIANNHANVGRLCANANEVGVNTNSNYNPPSGQENITISGLFENEIIRLLIGKGGCHFKRITEESGASYIWHNRDTNVIEIFGEEENRELAKTMIQYEIYLNLEKWTRFGKPLKKSSSDWLQSYKNMLKINNVSFSQNSPGVIFRQ